MNRKLDASVAIALGRKVVERGGEYWYPGRIPHRVEFFSVDGNDMLDLMAEMRKLGWFADHHIRQINGEAWHIVEFFRYRAFPFSGAKESFSSGASTMPKAVTLAVHYAITEKEWIE